MKLRIAVLASIFASSLLAACGGGGGGPTPNPLPSTKPATTYASKLVFVGSLDSNAVQSDLRRAESATVMASGTPLPIMVVAPPESGMDTSMYGGEVQAVVSPMPSSIPAVTFQQNNPDAVLQSPSPAPTGATPAPLPSGVIAQATVFGANTAGAQSAGTAQATIGSPVDQQPTTPVYSYMSIALDCGPGPGGIAAGSSTPYTNHFGWKYDGSTWVADDDVTTADVYIDGPSCVAQNAAESELTVHVPGGDTRLSTDTPFNGVAAASWTNAETSFTIQQAIQANADGSNNGFVLGKTRDGSFTFKLYPNALGISDGYFGAIEVSGSASIDGF